MATPVPAAAPQRRFAPLVVTLSLLAVVAGLLAWADVGAASSETRGAGASVLAAPQIHAHDPEDFATWTVQAPPSGSPVPGIGLGRHVEPSCSGEQEGKGRVQALWVQRPGDPLLDAAWRQRLLEWSIAGVDDIFAVSAARTGGGVRVRWVHDENCVPTIETLTVPADAPDYPFAELAAAGYNRPDRKYLLFSRNTTVRCTALVMFEGSRNRTHGSETRPMYANLGQGCHFPQTVAHELAHLMGAVEIDTPHSNRAGHCTDELDLLCYVDHTGIPTTLACTTPNDLLDCGNDDYFHTDPAPGSFLDTHWNLARSRFLDHVAPLRFPEVTLEGDLSDVRVGPRYTVTAAIQDADAEGLTYQWRFDSGDSCELYGPDNERSATFECRYTIPVASTAYLSVTGRDGAQTRVRADFTVRGHPDAPQGGIEVLTDPPLRTAPIQIRARIASDEPVTYWWDYVPGCELSARDVAAPTMTCIPDHPMISVPLAVYVRKESGPAVRMRSKAVFDIQETQLSLAATRTKRTYTVTGGMSTEHGMRFVKDRRISFRFAPYNSARFTEQSLLNVALVGGPTGGGTYGVEFAPPVPGRIRTVYAGELGYAGTTSNIVALTLPTGLKVAQRPERIVRARLSDAVRNRPLVLEVRTPGTTRWTTGPTRRTNAHGVVEFGRLRPGTRVRVVAPDHRGWLTATSPVLRVR